MVEETRILLIDNNEHSRHDLETVLSFLGEETISATSCNWHSLTVKSVNQPSQITVAIIGVCDLISLEQLLDQFLKWEAGTPFVLVGVHEIREFLD